MKKLYIIGGGPAGMMAAISAKTYHPELSVTIIEDNERLGEKLRLTGGGRCNLTALVSEQEVVNHTFSNGKFLYSALKEFNPKKIWEFFSERGVPLKVEDHQRVFPNSNRAEDIIKTLEDELKKLGVAVKYQTRITSVDVDKKRLCTNTQSFEYDYLIIAGGGKSYIATGSDGVCYELVGMFGHTIAPLMPAEVPLVSNDAFIAAKTLQGLAFSNIELSIYDNKKVKKRITHDLIFTHFGISGGAALRASYYVNQLLLKNKTVLLTIDFLPEVSYEALKSSLKEEGVKILKEQYQFPTRFINYISEGDIVDNLKKMPISIYSTRGYNNAFVTSGGVNIKEVSPQTMKSKLYPELSFAGEVLDLAGHTGGYNITIAFVTGYVAGKYIIA